jgi:hypothetical protein
VTNHFERLGVAEGSDPETIRLSFCRLRARLARDPSVPREVFDELHQSLEIVLSSPPPRKRHPALLS